MKLVSIVKNDTQLFAIIIYFDKFDLPNTQLLMEFEILPIEEFRVLKVIQIEGPNWNRFSAYLPYVRPLTKTYQAGNKDEIDEKLLSLIKVSFPDSYLRYDSDIMLKGALEEALRILEGGSRKSMVIQFFPLIPFERAEELVGRHFTAYPIAFSLRLLFTEGTEIRHYIPDYLLCSLDFDRIDDKVKTIIPV